MGIFAYIYIYIGVCVYIQFSNLVYEKVASQSKENANVTRKIKWEETFLFSCHFSNQNEYLIGFRVKLLKYLKL